MTRDPMPELERLRAVNRRWRRAAVGAVLAFVGLFVVSVVQFLGTFVTCGLLHEARQEAAKNRQEAAQAIQEIQDARQRVETASKSALGAAEVVDGRLKDAETIAGLRREMVAREAKMEREKKAALEALERARAENLLTLSAELMAADERVRQATAAILVTGTRPHKLPRPSADPDAPDNEGNSPELDP